jgi:hypothetical protein
MDCNVFFMVCFSWCLVLVLYRHAYKENSQDINLITKQMQDNSVPLPPDLKAVRFKNMKHELKRFLEMTDEKLEKERKRWVLYH